MSYCNECLRSGGHHPNCPNAEDAPESTFTVWQVGKVPDTVLTSEAPCAKTASKLGFDANIVLSEGEADIVNENGIVMGGYYINVMGGGSMTASSTLLSPPLKTLGGGLASLSNQTTKKAH